jgi:hypothetical protein
MAHERGEFPTGVRAPLLPVRYVGEEKARPPHHGPSRYNPTGAPFKADTNSTGGSMTGDLLPTYVSPEMTRNKMREVDAYADALHVQIDAALPMLSKSPENQTFYTIWLKDFATWKRFYADNIDVFWAAKGVIEQTEGWQLRLQDWRARFEKIGVKINTPDPAKPYESLSPSDAIDAGGKTLLAIGAIGTGVCVLYLLTGIGRR